MIKVFFFIFLSCSGIQPIFKNEEIIVPSEKSSQDFENKEEFSLSKKPLEIDLILLGNGFNSLSLSSIFKFIEDEKIIIKRINGKGFGLVLSELYKEKRKSNLIDWLIYKNFNNLESSSLGLENKFSEAVTKLIYKEFKNSDIKNQLVNETSLLKSSTDYDDSNCLEFEPEENNKIWCIFMGIQDRTEDLTENTRVFELSGIGNSQDSLVDILERGKIYFKESLIKE